MFLSNTDTPVIQVDDSCLIVDCNNVASEFTGLERGEIKGKHLSTFLKTDSDKTRSSIGETNYFVSRFHHSSGIVAEVVIHAHSVFSKGERFCYLTIFDVSAGGSGSDSTDSKALKVLTGQVAHDLNNVLTGILGSLSILRGGGGTGDLQEKLLKNAESGTLQAREITDKMLSFSRGEITPLTIFDNNLSLKKALSVSVDEPASGRLLLLDDNSFVANTAIGMLSTLGYSVDVVSEGRSVVKKYRESVNKKNRYKAVIMDLTIEGGIGGAEAVKLLLKVDPDAVCILSSGFAGSEIMQNYRSYGFKATLSKPYTVRELFESLNTALQN